MSDLNMKLAVQNKAFEIAHTSGLPLHAVLISKGIITQEEVSLMTARMADLLLAVIGDAPVFDQKLETKITQALRDFMEVVRPSPKEEP
jgi:hypothetical protein